MRQKIFSLGDDYTIKDDGGADRCPVASAWAAEELSLPMFEHLGDTEIDRVAAACKSAVAA